MFILPYIPRDDPCGTDRQAKDGFSRRQDFSVDRGSNWIVLRLRIPHVQPFHILSNRTMMEVEPGLEVTHLHSIRKSFPSPSSQLGQCNPECLIFRKNLTCCTAAGRWELAPSDKLRLRQQLFPVFINTINV